MNNPYKNVRRKLCGLEIILHRSHAEAMKFYLDIGTGAGNLRLNVLVLRLCAKPTPSGAVHHLEVPILECSRVQIGLP